MSLLDRLFRSNRTRAYDEGLALLEQGQYAEAVDILRRAVESARPDSLGGNLLRRALQAEGRRLLRSGRPAEAVGYLGEAAEIWNAYPDLQWWHGTALGLSGDWNGALTAAAAALRRNPEYPEARLLEAAALTALDRRREAARSLMSLRESGRRQDHWLTRRWDDTPEFTAENLPDDLAVALEKVVKGESEKDRLAAAVALCRAGDWEQGTAVFRELVRKRPRYPDYRTRLAAALFQVGSLDEALLEVEAALALHDGYAAALDLKALILADMGRFREARDYLQENESVRTGQNPGSLEALFGAYLFGVLDLLLGRPETVAPRLERWQDLVRDFAWAELLLAAADTLRGRHQASGLRLTALARAWPADPEYAYLLACRHLAAGEFEKAASILDEWPREDVSEPDQRPLYLRARLSLAQGHQPELPASALAAGDAREGDAREGDGHDPGVIPRVMPREAWTMVRAEAAFLRGADQDCWRLCQELEAQGLVCERSLDLMLQCAENAISPVDWSPPAVLPTRCISGACALHLRRDDNRQANAHLRPIATLYPENLVGMFLRPDFWLHSVRKWLS